MRWRSSVINLAGLLSLAVLFGCLFSNTAFAKLEVPAAPPLERPIIDQTESLANEDQGVAYLEPHGSRRR